MSILKRKDFIKKIGALGAGTLLVSAGCQDKTTLSGDAPAIIPKKKYRWKMVTTWPPNFPVFGEAANLFAQWINEMSDGQMQIKVYGGGELVPALEAFDAVSSGTVQMGSGGSYYWAGKSPAFQYFGAVPFGMNQALIQSWLVAGEGKELMKELYGRFNLVPFVAGNTGMQMGGWFNKEINNIEDFHGLKMRIPGLGGKTLQRAGGSSILVAGGEIYTSLERGVIDATEWVGPYHDYRMGFYKIAKYYYVNGWHEPGSQLDFFVNKREFEKLPNHLKTIIESASMRIQAWMLCVFNNKNGEYMDKLVNEENVQLRRFSKDILDKLRVFNSEVMEEVRAHDDFTDKVHRSYMSHLTRVGKWLNITDKAYYEGILPKIEPYI